MLLQWEDKEIEFTAHSEVSPTKKDNISDKLNFDKHPEAVEDKSIITHQNDELQITCAKCEQFSITLAQVNEQLSLKEAEILSLKHRVVVVEEQDKQRKEQSQKATSIATETIEQLQV